MVILLITFWNNFEILLLLFLYPKLMDFLDSLSMEIKVTFFRWLLVHSFFIRGDVVLLVINSIHLNWFWSLLLSLANTTLRTNWQSINRFFHILWVQSELWICFRKNAILYLHSNISRRNLVLFLRLWILWMIAWNCLFTKALSSYVHVLLVIFDIHLCKFSLHDLLFRLFSEWVDRH